ncbi:hypothetical protein SAMD00079811_66430 [Scytonema sp. HK-05]|uniref:hypothetical protein n=1 Tax=Scytonema sp. HK-05 TaxID=1137095 RepID=UPI000AC884D1|nr:hypothetical protein [Scytonema sp. HK-05]BAY49014.1 hypothetical protein SAMD00079811_66430 [Scytonema sp. HK-05]
MLFAHRDLAMPLRGALCAITQRVLLYFTKGAALLPQAMRQRLGDNQKLSA